MPSQAPVLIYFHSLFSTRKFADRYIYASCTYILLAVHFFGDFVEFVFFKQPDVSLPSCWSRHSKTTSIFRHTWVMMDDVGEAACTQETTSFWGEPANFLFVSKTLRYIDCCVAYVFMYTCIPPSRGVDPGPAHDIYTEPLRFFRVFRVIQGYPAHDNTMENLKISRRRRPSVGFNVLMPNLANQG